LLKNNLVQNLHKPPKVVKQKHGTEGHVTKKPPESLVATLLVCAVCGGNAHTFCATCKSKRGKQIFICSTACAKTHLKSHPKLTETGCITCQKPPDGTCAYCPAPVCNGLACEDSCRNESDGSCHEYCGKTCREVHEAKHFDARSDEDKKNKKRKP